MSGMICLQGGREFTPDCEEMDAEVLRRTGAGTPDRPVAVLAGAARVGDDHDGAIDRARRHYLGLGAHVVGVPDPRVDADGARRALDEPIGLLVLPGGSPSSLVDVLVRDDARIGRRVIELALLGTAISGASAGAMVLCDFCVLPDRSRLRQTAVAPGLGLVEGLAIPHWTPGPPRWSLPDDAHLWGLPECGGVLVEGGAVEAIGRGTPSFRHANASWVPVIRRLPAPT